MHVSVSEPEEGSGAATFNVVSQDRNEDRKLVTERLAQKRATNVCLDIDPQIHARKTQDVENEAKQEIEEMNCCAGKSEKHQSDAVHSNPRQRTEKDKNFSSKLLDTIPKKSEGSSSSASQPMCEETDEQVKKSLNKIENSSREETPGYVGEDAKAKANRQEVANENSDVQVKSSVNCPSHHFSDVRVKQHRVAATADRPRLQHKHSQTSLSSSSSSSSDDQIQSKGSTVALEKEPCSCRCSFSDSSITLPSRRRRRSRRPLMRQYRRRKPRRRLSFVVERKKNNHDEVKLFTVGVLQICAGAISIPLGIANYYIERVAGKNNIPPSGIWCGIIFILTGAQAVITSRYPSRIKAFVGLGLSIVSALSSIAVEVFEVMSATEQAKCNQSIQEKTSRENTLLCLKSIFALHIALCGVVFTEIVISGVHTYYGFQVSKHQKAEKEVIATLKAVNIIDV